MLVRWGKKVFLLAYLIDSSDNALKFSRKLLTVMREEPFQTLSSISMRVGSSVQCENDDIYSIISRAHKALQQTNDSCITVL
jgi:GGDEF domain-containing protein